MDLVGAFEQYEDKGGDHRWRLRHRNGNILADGSQGYADRTGAVDAAAEQGTPVSGQHRRKESLERPRGERCVASAALAVDRDFRVLVALSDGRFGVCVM
nr:YegP family protein [Natrinema versiforme]